MTASTPDELTIRPERRNLLWRSLQCVAYLLTTLLFDLKVFGRRNVPLDGGVLFLANHQSYLDPVLIAVKLDRGVSFLARHTLFKGLFGKLIVALNAHPIRQGKGDIGAMRQSIALLQSGHALLVFPEGTRTPDGEMRPLAPGLALLVKRAKVPVVPVAIDGAFQAWPRHRPMFRAARVRIMYGAPMDLEGVDGAQAVARVEAEVRRMLAELRQMGA